MTDEIPESGNVFADLAFTIGAVTSIAMVTIGFHALAEALRQKDRKEERER